MDKRAGILLVAGASVAAVAGATVAPIAKRPAAPPAPSTAAIVPAVAAQSQTQIVPSGAIATSIARWKSLRGSDSMPFSSYANFLASHRGWPGEAAMRRTAERRIDPGSDSPREVIAFFNMFPPLTASGHAKHALALLASGQAAQAEEAARRAWRSGVMAQEDEARLLGTFGSRLGPADHDARLDALLSNGDTQSAQRAMAWASSARRPIYETRLALQTRASDAEARFAALPPSALNDPGLLADRANWLRDTGNSYGARQLLAQSRTFSGHPANPAKFMETLVAMARGASNDSQWTIAYQIAAQVDGVYPPGTDVSAQSFGERNEYTNLTWLGGQAAQRMGRHADAARMFDLYGRAARSSQTRSKGFYWAARSAAAAGQAQQSSQWLQQAAAYPDQFYGQLALERLGRTPPAPPPPAPVTAQDRAAFERRPLAQAVRHLGMTGDRATQTEFVRALAGTLENDRERAIASEFGRSIGRLDTGVWAAREARTSGDSFYTRAAFPQVAIPPAYRSHWSAAHGIMRQESSFERSAISSANARGMMQLLPSTAQIEARRLGVPFSTPRLTDDPDYNILLGTAHLSRLMERFGNNLVLVAVAYNAGPGRVPQWIERNGDPRSPNVDVIEWIEQIPFSETRNYVQRVVENAVIYDTLNPEQSRSQGRVSYYLGQRALR